ncbi:MAG: hypothetical protein ABEK50_15050 [bacterium]
MAVEFTAQEMRNVFAGLDRNPEALEPLNTEDTVYLERDLSNKVFRVYGTEPDEYVQPLIEVDPDDGEATFGFINRYYMLREGTFNPMENDSDPL